MRGGELVNRTVPFLNSFLFRWSKEIVHEISKMKKKETQEVEQSCYLINCSPVNPEDIRCYYDTPAIALVLDYYMEVFTKVGSSGGRHIAAQQHRLHGELLAEHSRQLPSS